VAKDGFSRLTVGFNRDEFSWLHEEAERRGWSVGQVVRHCVDETRDRAAELEAAVLADPNFQKALAQAKAGQVVRRPRRQMT
jgi:hypothetical protein